jgi:hypothetical protein
MSAEQENYESNQEQQQYQQDEDSYSSSSEDEWTRPSLRNDDENNNNNNANNQNQSDNNDSNNATGTIEKKIVDYSWNEDEQALAGNEVWIEFTIQRQEQQGDESNQNDEASSAAVLPAMCFVMGVTIAHLKSYLDDSHNLPYTSQKMFLGDRELIDPLSLNDLGFEGGQGVVNKVLVVISTPVQ